MLVEGVSWRWNPIGALSAVQASVVKTRSNIKRYCIKHWRNWGMISISCWIHKRRASYGVSFLNIYETIDRIIITLHCIYLMCREVTSQAALLHGGKTEHIPTFSQTRSFLAATKQLYKWYFPSVRLSVCPSVCPSHLFDYVPIIGSSWNFQELLPMTNVRSMQKVKVRGQRSRSQRSQPNLTVSGL